ncbi:hypothetical protein [Streptomyces sp. NPDC057403]|uniref:hypothetical protein n=1 Tax=Streptomyces sp. NPDC057403 TaxID=3346119 RepID=UPI0036942167
MTETPTPRAWDDDDNKPVIPKIPHPRPASQHDSIGLQIAVSVAREVLVEHGDSNRPGFSYAAATGALSEALRLLLRAVDAEPEGKEEVFTGSRKNPSDQRCPAAHPQDPTPCDGDVVVTVLDARNAGANGCEWHGARLLASLDGGRVYGLPDAPEGTAIRVFQAAGVLRPFAWIERGEGR